MSFVFYVCFNDLISVLKVFFIILMNKFLSKFIIDRISFSLFRRIVIGLAFLLAFYDIKLTFAISIFLPFYTIFILLFVLRRKTKRVVELFVMDIIVLSISRIVFKAVICWFLYNLYYSGECISTFYNIKLIFTILTFLPLFTAFILLFVPRQKIKRIFRLSVISTIVNLLLIFIVYTSNLDMTQITYFYTFKIFQFQLNFGFDSISFILISLTSLLTLICLISGVNMKNFKEFCIYFLIIQFFLFLAWTVLDIFIFYICFESVLIPMFLVINFWGSRNRKTKAAYMFFIYTLAGSISMLIAIFYIFIVKGTTNLIELIKLPFLNTEQKWIWLAFFLAMAVKTPIIPFHSWLPEAHVEAPTPGSVLLAGILLKLGGYGLLRFLLPLFPEASIYFSTFIIPLCLCSILFASLTALRQNDLKRVIAYASIAHMNLIILGIFSFNIYGIQGSIFQMVSHGLVSSLLFLCIGVLYERSNTRLIQNYSGLVSTMPKFTFVFFIATVSNMAHPGTSSFIGEFLLFFGIFQSNMVVGVFSTLGIFLCGTYSIWLFNRISFGNIQYKDLNNKDLKPYERFYMAILIFCIFYLGLQPNIIFEINYSSIINGLLNL